MRGPLTEAQVTNMVGRLWLPARRFVIRQGSDAHGGKHTVVRLSRLPTGRGDSRVIAAEKPDPCWNTYEKLLVYT